MIQIQQCNHLNTTPVVNYLSLRYQRRRTGRGGVWRRRWRRKRRSREKQLYLFSTCKDRRRSPTLWYKHTCLCSTASVVGAVLQPPTGAPWGLKQTHLSKALKMTPIPSPERHVGRDTSHSVEKHLTFTDVLSHFECVCCCTCLWGLWGGGC